MLRTSDIFTCLSNSFGGETWGKLFYLTLHYDAWKHKIKICWYVVFVDFGHSPTPLPDKAVCFVIQHRTMKVNSGRKGPHFNVGIRTVSSFTSRLPYPPPVRQTAF